MTVSVTITFDNIEAAITGLARLRADTAPAPVKVADAPKSTKADKPAKEEKPSPAPAPAAASSEPSAASKANGAAPPASETKPDYGPVGEAIKNGVAAGKRPEVVAALEQFGAKSGKDLKPEQYAPFMEVLTKALSGEAADLG